MTTETDMTKEYIVIAFSENQAGVLNRITSLYLRRKINIESLKVSETSMKGISMFVISALTTESIISKLVKQIKNIIEVIEVDYYSGDQLITQEIALYKISAGAMKEPGLVENIVRNFAGRIIEITPSFIVIEKSGTREENDQLRDTLETKKLLQEFTRSGSVVLHREDIHIEDKLNIFKNQQQ